MPKGGKSSATSGTRRKHAKKAAHNDDDPNAAAPAPAGPTKLQRGQKKLSKAQKKALPKVKQFVPPPKPPAPPIPDPLDGMGLARTLPPELVVVLRRLGKKDDVTRRKGLEELRDWVAGLGKGDDEVERELMETTLVSALPVWVHNLASLLQSPFHRTAALQVHAELLALPALRAGVVDALVLGLLPGTQGRDVLGSWMVAALEEGRRSGGSAIKCWDSVVELSAPTSDTGDTDELAGSQSAGAGAKIDLGAHIADLTEYLSLSTLDPQTLHRDIHPAPISSTPSTPAWKAGKGGAKGRPAVPAVSTPGPEEDAEVAEERWARYRIGGLVGLSWLVRHLAVAGYVSPPAEVLAVLQNPLLWSAVSAMPTPINDTPIGSQPPIRRAAYALLATLIDVYPSQVADELLQTVAPAVLWSCWSEKESGVWETAGTAVVKLLTKYPQSWDISTAQRSDCVASAADPLEGQDEQDDSEDEGSDDDADEEGGVEEVGASAASASAASSAAPSSAAFTAFLDFISTVCPSLAAQTYPLLLLVVSSIPPSILPLASAEPSLALQTFFSHLFSPLDARLLTTHALPAFDSPFQSFLYAAVDIATLLTARTHAESSETARWIATEQLGRAWAEGVIPLGGRKRGREVEAEAFGKALAKIGNMSSELAQALVGTVGVATLRTCFAAAAGDKAAAAFLPRVLPTLDALRDTNSAPAIIDAVDSIIKALIGRSVEALGGGLQTASTLTSVYADTLIAVLRTHSDLATTETVSALSKLLQRVRDMAAVLAPSTLAGLFAAFLSLAAEDEQQRARDALWRFIDSDADRDTRFALVGGFIRIDGRAAVRDGAFDRVITEATEAALGGNVGAEDVVKGAVSSDGWLSESAQHTVLALICSAVHSTVNVFLSDDMTASTTAIDLLAAYSANLDELPEIAIYVSALVAVHRLVSFLPQRGATPPPAAVALWTCTKSLDEPGKSKLQVEVQRALKDALSSVDDVAEPSTIVDVAAAGELGWTPSATEIASALLPPDTEIIATLRRHTARLPDPSLNIVDPLVPCAEDEDRLYGSNHDAVGRSEAARLAEAVLALTRLDRRFVAAQPTLVLVILYALVLARDHVAVSDSRGLYATAANPAHVRDVVQDAETALSFALSSVDESAQWHGAAVEAVKSGKQGGDWVQDLLVQISQDAQGDIGWRAFREILSRQIRQSGAGEAEANVWLQFAMSSINNAPNLALAIIHAVKPLLLDTKPLELAQNRLANVLTGIAPAQATARGLPLLRLLLASAPPADSAALFLPQNRALFVLRHLATWLASDTELADEIEPRVAELYTALAPVVQDVLGTHWDNMFDLLEAGLEVGLDSKDAWPLVYWSLKLLVQVRDLCSTNKSLRASWTGKDAHMGLVVKVFLRCRSAESEPLQFIHALVLDLLPDVPESVMEQASLPDLATLVRDSTSPSIQSAAYRILARVIKSQTLALVLEVEAAVADEPVSTDVRLPAALVDIVECGRAVNWMAESVTIEQVLGQLLAWMAILDHFDDASRTLRWAYLDQLNSSRLLDESLLPLLFAMLGVSEVGAWNFGASQYAVDEFYTDLLQPDSLADLTPLGSHVLYRALTTVPTAMRAFYTSVKSRQLSLSLLAYVARHFSPVVIAHEFAALRAPVALAQLADEGLAVKVVTGGGAVAGATAAEAVASYVVDDQPMEIAIRLPAEFPLRPVEIRDLRRVGVPENKWRGWLMGVQQTITSRNGLILEALTVFKKNVALHFEGVVECAICYSIISLTDRTLPTKPCRTCKNRFHASCLFKWFNSSHSSSCPLCRALF
ncbi:hypothetical protein Q5752_002106 [Cryptotrichosporon argae]